MKLKPSMQGRAPLLIGLGLLLMIAAGLLFAAGLVARQSLQTAERKAFDHAIELAGQLGDLQDRLADERVGRAALAALQAGLDSSDALNNALRAAGLEQVVSAQVFDPDLETLALDSVGSSDFAILDMLLEARRTGEAMPEVRSQAGQGSDLALARRLGAVDQPAEGVLFVRLPIEALIGRVDWATELDFIALSQGLGERRSVFWSRGSQPERTPARTPVPGTRFWLDWQRSTRLPLVGLREASIIAMAGLIVLLFGFKAPVARRRPQAVTDEPLQQLDPGASPAPGARPEKTATASLAATDVDTAAETRQARADEYLAVDLPASSDDPVPMARSSEIEAEPTPSLSLLLDSATLEATGQPDREVETPASDAPPALDVDKLPETANAPEPAAGTPERAEPELQAAAETPEPAEPETLAAADAPEQRAAAPSPVDPALFTDAGILGRFAAGLDGSDATLIGRAIAGAARERGVTRIAVARDGRLHGPALLAAVTEGLRSGGIDVVDVGAVPSPLLDFAAHELSDGSGIMVSAAHLPAEWNGFRMRLRGEPLAGRQIHELLDRIRAGESGDGNGRLEEASIVDRYIEAQTARMRLERPLKVVVECANGISGPVLPRLLSAIGAEVVPLYADVDGSFPNHPPDPSRLENLEDLRLCVRNFRADLGLAIGGDGDRVVMVGPDGTVIWPDRLLMLLARAQLARQEGGIVVHDALCSPRVATDVRSHGGIVRLSALGAPAVWHELSAHEAMLGGTFNGQFILADAGSGSADGLLAACRLVEILAADGREIDEILADLPSWHSLPAAFIATRPTPPDRFLNQLLESADVSDAEVSSEHGFTIDYGHAWARICRSADGSGLVVRMEGDDEPAARSLALLVRQMLLAVDDRLQLPF